MSNFNLNPPEPPSTPPPGPTSPPSPYSPPRPPYVPPAAKKTSMFTWIVIGGGAFFLFALAVFSLVYLAVKNDSKSASFGSGFSDKIAVVDLEGVIFESKQVITNLKKYEKDDSVKAIILNINSPGGGAEASKELYQYVKRIADKHNKEKTKPIVAVITSVGASGAYYAAAGSNKIYANDSSVVGSIGVIAQWVNYGDLMRWAKLKDVTLKAGDLKDAGSPWRDLTPAEHEYLQGVIDNMHQQFIHDVAVGRGMKDEDVKAIASGRIWTGQQAVPLKLIDQLADFQSALEDTAKSVGIKGEPTIIRPEKDKKTLYDILFGDLSDVLPDKARMMQEHVGFYYLWK